MPLRKTSLTGLRSVGAKVLTVLSTGLMIPFSTTGFSSQRQPLPTSRLPDKSSMFAQETSMPLSIAILLSQVKSVTSLEHRLPVSLMVLPLSPRGFLRLMRSQAKKSTQRSLMCQEQKNLRHWKSGDTSTLLFFSLEELLIL